MSPALLGLGLNNIMRLGLGPTIRAAHFWFIFHAKKGSLAINVSRHLSLFYIVSPGTSKSHIYALKRVSFD